MNKKYIVIGLIAILMGTVIYSFFSWSKSERGIEEEKKIITIAGSGSASFTLRNLTEAYNKNHPEIVFDFAESSDSGLGLLALKEERTLIAVASRRARKSEMFPGIEEMKFEKDAVVFAYNNPANRITSLTCKQLVEIYTGKIKNWDELGNEKNMPIIAFDREEVESSKKLFRDVCLQENIADSKLVQVLSEEAMATAILNSPGSIGFLSYSRAKTEKINFFDIDEISVEDNDYKYFRDFLIYTRENSSQEVKDFISFVKQKRSDELK